MWRVVVAAPRPDVPRVEAAFEDAEALSSFEAEEAKSLWRVEALYARKAEAAAAQRRLGSLADASALSRLPRRDWVAESLKGLPPIRAGRFWIRGGHIGAPPPAGAVALRIDAGPAFGTGQHETTRGCLLAIETLAKRRRFQAPLDLGCGTGVLAMAMARLWRVPVAASDIDPVAVREARANAAANGLAPWIDGVVAQGFASPALAGSARFDLIVANILARPLVRLAPGLRRALAPGGAAVLSGLLRKQERQTLGAYRSLGFRLERRFVLGDWPTLVLRR